jgi:hypothetical protein
MEEQEEKQCVWCERGLAIFGILIGAAFLGIGISVLISTLRAAQDEVEDGA